MSSMLERQRRAEPEPSILNYEYLAGLQKYLGAAHASELLADGMIDLVGRLDRLAEVAGRGDRGAVAALSHEIVGAAGHLGLGRMSHLAAQVSMAARGGDPAAWIEALLESRAASIGSLREYCATRLDAAVA
jgi:HPt (histidine-containing phosphotransfer) domain-containing protein